MEALANSLGLFANYQREVRRTLSLIEQDGHLQKVKTALKAILAGIYIT